MPSSLERVRVIRQQLASRNRALISRLSALQVESPPRLAIEHKDFPSSPRLIFTGVPERTYDLEATRTLSEPWQSLLTVQLQNTPLSWEDESMARLPHQFFRLRSGDPNRLAEPASNFRLLDHQGVSRDLYYHSHLAGIVLLAAADLGEVTPVLPLLREIAGVYSNRVETWILLSDPNAPRSNIVAQTKSLNMAFPVLRDPHGLAAWSVGLTRAGEVAVVQPPVFTIAYRGTVQAAAGSTLDNSYLGQALAGVIADRPPTFRRTTTAGALLRHVAAAELNYSTDIAPVLSRHCGICHHTGGVAPFAMTNHSVIAEWSESIKHALLSNRMPPWHADPEYGHFTNNLSLPDDSRAALVRWIDSGAPRGGGPDPLADSPPPPAYGAWPEDLGEPDALVTIPVQKIKATGTEAYRYIHVQAPNPTNVWLRAAIIRPSNYWSVHHYLVFLGRTTAYGAHIAEFVPGYKPLRYPSDSGVLLTKSNWLTFNLHYQTRGTATNDQPVLALWYHKSKPRKTWASAGIGNTSFAIPPGARDFAVQSQWVAPAAVTIYRLNPHMHLRGKRMKFEVLYPSGGRETLLSVPDYDFNWQIGYDLAEPKTIPAGTRINVSGAFDNSPQNLANPNPATTVRFGEQSWEEMFIGYVDYTQ